MPPLCFKLLRFVHVRTVLHTRTQPMTSLDGATTCQDHLEPHLEQGLYCYALYKSRDCQAIHLVCSVTISKTRMALVYVKANCRVIALVYLSPTRLLQATSVTSM